MTIAGLLKKHGIHSPRYVTETGRVLVAAQGASAAGLPVKSHSFHGGTETTGSESSSVAWWHEPDALVSDRSAVAEFFPGFTEVDQSAGDEPPAWEGTIDTGYGLFKVRVQHRADHGLPRVLVLDSKRRGKSRRGKWVPSPHQYLSGALCVAEEGDWDATKNNVADVIAWAAHWHACYVAWLAGDVWPTPGVRSVA